MDLENILDNQYVSTSLAVFLVLYGGLASPKLSKCMIKLFSNPLFRLIIIFLIAYTSSKNHSIALVATIVLILLMQESNDDVIKNESIVNSKSNVIVSKFKMDEEEEKTDGEIIHILKDKSTITEKKLISSVINDEISKLQSESNVLDEKPIDEPAKVIDSNEISEVKLVPEAIDKNADSHGIEIVDNPLSKNLEKGFETVSVKSRRGLKSKECENCNLNRDYEINTNDIILAYDGNGFYNFGNL